MGPFERIVAAVPSDFDPALLRYAAMAAGLNPKARLLLVHVAPASASPEEARRNLNRAAPPGATCHVLTGDLTDSLLAFAAAERADVILVGHRAGRTRRRSLARRLAMTAPCSVWMAPEGSPAELGGVLVPIDFSRHSAAAVSAATALAESAGQDECHALHVYFNRAAVSYEEYEEILIEEEAHDFHLFVAPVDLHGIHVKPLFVEGADVARTVLRVAEEQLAGLIVMGTRGRSRSAAVLLGSETDQVMMESRIPVLVVKRSGARMKLLQALRDRRMMERGYERFT